MSRLAKNIISWGSEREYPPCHVFFSCLSLLFSCFLRLIVTPCCIFSLPSSFPRSFPEGEESKSHNVTIFFSLLYCFLPFTPQRSLNIPSVTKFFSSEPNKKDKYRSHLCSYISFFFRFACLRGAIITARYVQSFLRLSHAA